LRTLGRAKRRLAAPSHALAQVMADDVDFVTALGASPATEGQMPNLAMPIPGPSQEPH